MPSSFEKRALTCPCGNTSIIQCYHNLNYDKWLCRSCAIKQKWTDPIYRSHRKPRKIKTKVDRNSVEYKQRISALLTGRKLSDDHRAAISKANKKLWTPEYKAKVKALYTPEWREACRKRSKAIWDRPGFRERYQTDAFRNTMRAITTSLWKNQEFRNKILKTKSLPEFKQKMRLILNSDEFKFKLRTSLAMQPKVSSLQTILYSMLDDLGVHYYREYNDRPDDPECTVGPWTFDCVIPRHNSKTLLIECNGDFIHGLPHKIVSDTAKRTYIETYLSDQYELKTIWEHEFANHNRVIDLLKYWLNKHIIDIVDFSFDNIVIKPIKALEYRELLQKYHYLSNAGRGGIAYGGYLGQKLIGVCIFSPLARQNIVVGEFKSNQIRELSRFCVHPNYNQSNIGSWLISRCIKMLPRCYKAIISYADTTFNHCGGLYKASNFKLDKEVKPDYWYRAPDGWVMHKKTLYNKATSLKLTERQYAEKFGYYKVFGSKKLRFLFVR